MTPPFLAVNPSLNGSPLRETERLACLIYNSLKNVARGVISGFSAMNYLTGMEKI
jgi:hypothetical protein